MKKYCASGLGVGVCYNNSTAVNVAVEKKMALNVFWNFRSLSCHWLSGFKNQSGLL